MSERLDLLGQYDVKENRLLKSDIRRYVNDTYNGLLSGKEQMQKNIRLEQLFGELFETFTEDYSELLHVWSFLLQMRLVSEGVFHHVMGSLDALMSEVLELYKQVYVESEE